MIHGSVCPQHAFFEVVLDVRACGRAIACGKAIVGQTRAEYFQLRAIGEWCTKALFEELRDLVEFMR